MRTSLKIYENLRKSMKILLKSMKIAENLGKCLKVGEKKNLLFSLGFLMFFNAKSKKPDFSGGRGGSGGRAWQTGKNHAK